MSEPAHPGVPPAPPSFGKPEAGLRRHLYNIIFESDTLAGRRFDIVLVAAILTSIAVVVIDSVPSTSVRRDELMKGMEWFFTILFSIEYLARLCCVRHPLRYATSFYGVIDLLSVLPTYLSLLLPGSELLIDIRILRLLRVFRIFKLTHYMVEFSRLSEALVASRRKIAVFLSFVVMAILILGTVMYVVEGPENGFYSIPVSMYWATVTMTTVGYGDLTPHTVLGRIIASMMMLLGWGVLAVPTGIVTAEMTSRGLALKLAREVLRQCGACGSSGHEPEARFCKDCGTALAPSPPHSGAPS